MQIREDPITQAEELSEFMRYGKLQADQIDVLDVFTRPYFDESVLTGYDALFIGGSSDASVLAPQKFPFVESCQALLKHTIRVKFPVFASCFGFQLLVCAAGGTVICDRPNLEMGVYPLSHTAESQEDPLFQDLPNPFLAVSGHQERALNLPDNLTNLAFSERCPYHAIKVKDCPIYGFQFHPEVDADDLKARLDRYQSRYLDDTSQVQAILEQIQETPDANQLIASFIDHILLT